MELSGWGRYPVLDCRVARLRRCGELAGLLAGHRTLIARGNGRAYGDAALNPALTLSMLAMDGMQGFDPDTGLLTCQAGVLLSDVLARFVPRGWFPPVVPGTGLVTVGGMIAADVHGKNHLRDGSFGAHVESLTLAAADGETRRCSRSENPDLFRATLGGMGLTGVILSASFRLRRIESAFVLAETVAARDLDETLALLEASGRRPFSAAWIDGLARGAGLGRSLVSRGAWLPLASLPARLASNPLRPAAPPRLAVPCDAPSALLNRTSIRLFNALRYRRGRLRGGERPAHYGPFLFPLDGVAAWNRLYGRRGFVQYQCALPKAESPRGLAALLECAATGGQAPFLAVLKRFGPAGEGLMSFPMEGHTLALDFPMRSGVRSLLEHLDGITHDHGGRVYLAKDACAAPERIRQGYPRLDEFNAARAEANGGARRFASALSRRLGL